MANTYTGDMGAIEKNIQSLTTAVSQGYSGLPGVTEALRKSLYEREKTLPGLENDVESKIKELYTADKTLAERYGNTNSEVYIEDPMARQAAVSGQKADIRGEYGNILNLIQSRSQVLGNALDKGLEMYQAGLKAQEFELSQAEKAWERMFKKDQANKSGRSSGPSASAMSELAKLMLGRKKGWQPTEEKPKPLYEDQIARGINWRSPKGQWEWSYENNDWTPAGMQGTDRANLDLEDLLTKHPELGSEVLSGNIFKFLAGEDDEENLTQTEEYNQDLSEAAQAVTSGMVSRDEAIRRLSTKYGSKGATNIGLLLDELVNQY